MEVDYKIIDFDYVDIFVLDHVNAVVMSDNPDYMESLRNFFTDKVHNSNFFPAVKAGTWDGKIRHIKADGMFAVGLIPEMCSKCDDWDIKYRIHTDIDKTIDISNFDSVIQEELISKQKNPMQPWEHQVDIAKKLIKNKRGIARSATSSGKTYAMAMICKYLLYMKYAKKILILVPKTDLCVQGSRDLKGFGYSDDEVGMFFGEVKDTEHPVIISTWQSAMNQKDKFFEQFECVISDECFTGETLVNTEDGYKMIKDLKCGENIWSYNEETNETELKPITKIYENRTKSKKLIKITLENGKEIKCTPNHLFKTENRGWVQAKDLNSEDLLVKGNCDFI